MAEIGLEGAGVLRLVLMGYSDATRTRMLFAGAGEFTHAIYWLAGVRRPAVSEPARLSVPTPKPPYQEKCHDCGQPSSDFETPKMVR